jgi:purine-binding chemotaxis protein CheW
VTESLLTGTDRAAVLRDAFDSTFGRAPVVTSQLSETLLAIRVGHAPYAIRLSQTLGLHVDKPITSLPGTSPEVLGIAGFRGTIATVFDLRVLLGADTEEACRWLVLVSNAPAIGIAFDRFEGHLQCFPEDIATAPDREHGDIRLIEEVVAGSDGEARPIVNPSALIERFSMPDFVRARE